MENHPARITSSNKVKLLLAGVFLAALAAVPLLRHPAEFRMSDIGGASPSTASVSAGSGSAGTEMAQAATDGRSDSLAGNTPEHLRIPAINVDAPVVRVGLTSSGDMDTPKSSTAVAWYKLGPKPGEAGNAVMAGHVNTRYDPVGVFYHLDDLAAGDDVYVTDRDGKTYHFRVTGRQFLDADASPEQVFGAATGPHLNLVTCAGVWVPAKHAFDKRLVVFTELVD